MSDKSARTEFGLTQQEIFAAIRAGTPVPRAKHLRQPLVPAVAARNVEALVAEKSGKDHLHKKKLQKELADINKESRKLKTRLTALERRRAELMKELNG